MKAIIYNQEAQATGEITLPENLFGLPWNSDLVHQVVMAQAANSRQNGAYARGRGEVSGGGIKPWRQKGTGRARHGSSRSPIWVGGGVTHGPTLLRDYHKKLNRKMRSRAFFVILSRKFKDGEILFVSLPDLVSGKTKMADSYIGRLAKTLDLPALAYRTGKRVLIMTATKDDQVIRSFKNIPQVKITNTLEVGPLELMNYKYIIVAEPESVIAALAGRVHFTAQTKEEIVKEVVASKTTTKAKVPTKKKVASSKTK